MGLNIDVYKSSLGDATMNGISSKAKTLCLVNVDGPFNPNPTHPAAMLIKGNGAGLVKIVPAHDMGNGSWIADQSWCMMGGNYGATSDSRFHRAVEKITGGQSYGAVPIHDRIED